MAVRDRTETTLSEINVTPLVDVMLVLLIIFMVTAPMLSTSVEVQLQTASTAPPREAKEHLIVSVDAAGQVYVSDVRTDLEVLAHRVKQELERTALPGVAIRGDRGVEYGRVLQVLDRLRAAEVKNVGLVMAPRDPREGRRGEAR